MLHKEEYILRGEIHSAMRGRQWYLEEKRLEDRHISRKSISRLKRIVEQPGRATYVYWCDELREV